MPGAEKDTAVLIKLRKELYFEKRLSVNHSISCNSCHPVDHYRPGAHDDPASDVTKDESDTFKFKVPSLRNVALTAPYFDDGKVARLDQAVRQMACMQLDRQITDAQVGSLVAFLKSLSDGRFRAA
jgi:cytochrome c peroxidase